MTITLCDRGERTAAAMENQLTALERKIDDLLASVDQSSSEAVDEGSSQSEKAK